MKNFKLLSIFFLISLGAGCATTDIGMMTPETGTSNESFPGSANVIVVGANEVIAKNADIKTAIEIALTNAQLFVGDERNYRINVSVLSIKNPIMGLDLKSELRIKWQLIDLTQDKLVWEDFLSNDFTATVGDSFVAVTRMRMSNEGVIRENIQMAIDEMITLREKGEGL
jgi:hypothetical protein